MPQMKPRMTTKVAVPEAGMFRPKLPDESEQQYAFLKRKHAARYAKDTAGHRDARARAVKKMAYEG